MLLGWKYAVDPRPEKKYEDKLKNYLKKTTSNWEKQHQ